ncbi:ribonuclease R [Prolixibacteraceae bacterium JC049]|nr:ribonuclease R [Prolixibacteraceae bacterium JC049]
MAKKKKKFKKKNKTFNKRSLKRHILNIFYDNPTKTLNYKQISAELGIKDQENRKLIYIVLCDLADSGKLTQIQTGKFKLKTETRGGTITGVMDLTQQGYGFVVTEELEEDVFVSQSNLKQAMDGDKVKVRLRARSKRRKLEGEVIEIIERARTQFVGTIQMSRNFAFLVMPRKGDFDIFIPKEKLNGAKDGQKALVKITEWPSRAKSPFGEVIEVLGDVGSNDAEMHAILAEFDLPIHFPEKVLKAAEKIDMELDPEEVKKRRDFRKITTFTIDPADAKDFDDALSIQKLENGNWEIGVHIADVTHYVKPDTTLDKEAFSRATSVYLVDRVVPMLPEKLSNGVCSLRPNEEKFCFSAVFEMDDEANVKNEWFGRTVIYSDRRFAYEEAQEVIETGVGELSEEILTMNRLAEQMRARRFDNGSIAFDRVEVKFNIDDDGKPLGVYFKEAKAANKLIEEFMLLANKKVAEFIGKVKAPKKPKTFVYRIHDKPDLEKLESFNHFINKFGYGIQTATAKTISTSINHLLENVKGKGEQNVVETLAVRTMAKAEYSTRNIGHYGLGFELYSHFTSPIRRYPDMMVHRLLARYLDGGRSASEDKYEDMCKHSSDMETRASNAERSSIKYKQVEFMMDKVGEEFEGVISGVTDWGIYVEISENKCEGMVALHELDDDFYHFNEKEYCIEGEHTDKKYQLGDKVTVEIVRANLERKQLDFKLVEEEAE